MIHTRCVRTAKALVRLRGVWSDPLLFADSFSTLLPIVALISFTFMDNVVRILENICAKESDQFSGASQIQYHDDDAKNHTDDA